jgi:hypothetical protein
VALGARGCLAEPHGSDSADTVGQIAGFVVLGLCATFLCGEEETVKGGADFCFLVGIRQDVAGELLADEVSAPDQEAVLVAEAVPEDVGVLVDVLDALCV